MKLSAIEAMRYGAFEGACLSGLGDGLTVILGPNESGKSTMTALTRHVLYGYPDARTKEYGYVSSAGPRVARLVFAENGGEWAIERVDGKSRGPVTVSARHGEERPGLLGELVSGVSEQSYKVVFGFGLDELAAIEQGDAADIVSRLYAAGTGLSVNPMDVRGQIETRAATIWAPRAQKPTVNALASEIRDCKERLRTLETAAASYAADQNRLAELAATLQPLKERAIELETLGRVLDRDAARLGDAVAVREELAVAASDLAAQIADIERARELIDVDERVIAAAPAITALLEETAVFRERLKAMDEQEAAAAEARRRAVADGALPAGAVDSVASRTEVERRRDELAQLRTDATAAARAAELAEARFAAVEKQAAEVVPERRADAGTRSRTPLVLAVGAILAGAAFAVAGVALQQFLAAALGGILIVAGVVALVWVMARKPVVPAAVASFSEEVSRARVERDAAVTIATEAARRLDAATNAWKAWLAEQQLDAFGDDPIAVRSLLDSLAERQRLYAEADRFTADAARTRDAAEAWVLRLVEVTSAFESTSGQIPTLEAGLELASRARVALERARSAEAERVDLGRKLEAMHAERRKVTERLEAAEATAAEIVTRHGLSSDDPLPALQSLAAARAAELADARAEVERVATEHDSLSGVLGTEGRDRQMALARQELEGLKARAAAAADRYVVDALAVKLLNQARERFERERQPEVVRTAGRVFSAMTGGRYTDVRVPLDQTVTVLTSTGVVRTSEQLSRGTAEQLYLALRVGLISSLGATGSALPVLMDDVVVNFDPTRREGAVLAIGELAAIRQVLFFTCHPETAAALTAGVAGSKVLQMDRCTL